MAESEKRRLTAAHTPKQVSPLQGSSTESECTANIRGRDPARTNSGMACFYSNTVWFRSLLPLWLVQYRLVLSGSHCMAIVFVERDTLDLVW